MARLIIKRPLQIAGLAPAIFFSPLDEPPNPPGLEPGVEKAPADQFSRFKVSRKTRAMAS